LKENGGSNGQGENLGREKRPTYDEFSITQKEDRRSGSSMGKKTRRGKEKRHKDLSKGLHWGNRRERAGRSEGKETRPKTGTDEIRKWPTAGVVGW